ncbi:hypothetical protein NPX13_g3593 [Xylaria arbuscula]|uniref:Uncharacterized protein n=1 Tax=Xylaria arbuscula TaxID=114810 RepID=A0A9W8NHG4_9PEZI|nr:hypothetical protein NPX13_g3593 [Xylaria arbuscula]
MANQMSIEHILNPGEPSTNTNHSTTSGSNDASAAQPLIITLEQSHPSGSGQPRRAPKRKDAVCPSGEGSQPKRQCQQVEPCMLNNSTAGPSASTNRLSIDASPTEGVKSVVEPPSPFPEVTTELVPSTVSWSYPSTEAEEKALRNILASPPPPSSPSTPGAS